MNPAEKAPPAVSGLVCGAFLTYADSHGGSAADLAAGLGESPERLRQWHAWFPWETYLELERRFGEAMAHLEDPFSDLGRCVVTQRWLGPAGLVLRTVGTAAQPYRIVPWLVPRFLLSGATIEHREPADDLVVLDYHFPAHVDPTAPFLQVIRGQLVMGPTFVGQPQAEVSVTRHDHRVTRFEVRLPQSNRKRREGALGWLGSRIAGVARRSRVVADLGGELLRTNALLGQKLRELEEANERLLEEASERQRAVAAVQASEERYRALSEAAEEVIVVLDDELRIGYVNPWAAALGGFTPGSLVGHSLREQFSEERFLSLRHTVREVLRTGRPHRSEGCWGSGEEERCFEAAWVPLKDAEGRADLVLCVAREITARRRAEREKELLDARLQHTQKMESLGVLVGGVAHDFNNLLTVVRGNAELARQRLPGDHPARGLLEPITQAAEEGAALCRLMLAFAGKGTLRQRRLDLSRTVRGMESLLRASVPDMAELRFQLMDGLPAVLGDRTQLRQLALNLVVNGAESLGGKTGQVTLRTGVFEPDEAEVEAAVEVPPAPLALRYVFLEVTDTGCGMDAETRARAFEPFFTTKFPGRGLGLAAVLGIVRGHAGLLTLDSSPSRGTRIRVGLPETVGEEEVSTDGAELPGIPPAKAEVFAEALGTAPLRAPWMRGEPAHGPVLLVDDEREIRELGRAVLEELGLEVLTAADGREALEHFREGGAGIAAAILDITMPHMDGEALFRALRERAPTLPVLLISGHGAQEVAARFEPLTPYAYLPKPFSVAELAEALQTLLAGGPAATD